MNFLKSFIKPRKGKSTLENLEALTPIDENDTTFVCMNLDHDYYTSESAKYDPLKVTRIEEVQMGGVPSTSNVLSDEDKILFEAAEAIKVVSANIQKKNQP